MNYLIFNMVDENMHDLEGKVGGNNSNRFNKYVNIATIAGAAVGASCLMLEYYKIGASILLADFFGNLVYRLHRNDKNYLIEKSDTDRGKGVDTTIDYGREDGD